MHLAILTGISGQSLNLIWATEMQHTFVQNQHGYRDGLQQPGQSITISFSAPTGNIDIESIDEWLINRLEVDIDPEPDQTIVSNESKSKEVFSLVWRILLVGRYFQQTARIPVFEPGIILTVSRMRNEQARWQSRVLVPIVDNLPANITNGAYKSAAELIHWVLENPHSSETPAQLYKNIQASVLKPLRSMVISGISTIPILKTAHQNRIPFRHLKSGSYQLGWGCKKRIIDRSSVDTDSAIGSTFTHNKFQTAILIRMAGLPAPVHFMVDSLENTRQAADRLGWPLVIKPADKERGEGVTVAIANNEKLDFAYKRASAISKSILVEREVPGTCYRLLITNGTMLYAIRRSPRSIEGDGRHSVAELIRMETKINSTKPPWLQEKPYPLDALALESMSLAGFTPDSVPEKGVWVPLRRIESTAWGGHIEDVTELVHPENRQIAEQAASIFRLSNAGIDIISSDISRPWHENQAIINEVNYAPYFGGNEIARSAMPTYLKTLISGDGRIPIEIVLGNDVEMSEAHSRQQALLNQGIDCYLTSHSETLKPDGQPMPFPFQSLFNRASALLMNRRVEALVLSVQTNELLQTGLPLNQVDKLIHTNDEISDWKDPGVRDETASEKLIELIEHYLGT